MKILKNELTAYIEDFVKAYAYKTQASEITFNANKSIHFSLIKYEDYYVELMYSFKNSNRFPKSTLMMRIYRSFDDPSFELGELLTYMGKKELRCTWYPYISNEKMMGLALSSLFSIFGEYRDEIGSVFEKYAKYRELEEIYAKEIRHIYRITSKSKDYNLTAHELTVKYNTSFEIGIVGLVLGMNEKYFDFLSGNYQKAREFYQKKHDINRTLMIEENILEAINQNKASKLSLIDKEYLREYQAFKNANKDSKVGLRILRNSLATLIFFLIIYVAVGLLMKTLLSRGTLLFYSDIIECAFISAGLPMIFGGIAMRNLFERIFNRKNAETVIRVDKMVNGKFLSRFSNTVFVIALLGSLLFNIFTYTQTERFYDEEMILHGNHMFQYETHRYSDSAKLYLRKGIINPYGDYIERDSYLLVFNDGTYYDFDGIIKCDEFLKSVYPLIKDYVGEIETIRCKEDIGLE